MRVKDKDPFKPSRKEKRQTRRRLKNAPPLPEKNDPFYIDKDGNEYSKSQYMNTFGTSKYTEKALDEHMSGVSSNKKKRRTKTRK